MHPLTPPRAFLLAAIAAFTGCGYSLGYRAPKSVSSIAVPIFNNQTFPLRREVEYELTAALREEVQSRTPLRLVDSQEADLVVYGTIRDFEERVIAEGRTDQKIESTIVIEVDVIVEDYRNQRRWQERVSVREPVSVQIGETVDLVRRRAIGNLAEKILEQIESWDEA